METKVVALDVYGTLLASNDAENVMPPRPGAIEFIERCKSLHLTLCTSSDAPLSTLGIDLRTTGVDLSSFCHFFKMEGGMPKDFRKILEHFKIKPYELLVIGDRYDKDIAPARELGCHWAHVEEYFDTRSQISPLTDIIIP